MALHNLKIVVVDGGKLKNYKSSGGNAKNSEKKQVNRTTTQPTQAGMSPSLVLAMNMGTKVASQVIRQGANYIISDIGRRNGDSNYQSMINRQIEQVTDVLSPIGGMISGMTTGAMFGPAGMIVGAVVGAASSAISLGFKYAERNRAYQHTLFEEHNNQAVSLARANFNVLSGRLR